MYREVDVVADDDYFNDASGMDGSIKTTLQTHNSNTNCSNRTSNTMIKDNGNLERTNEEEKNLDFQLFSSSSSLPHQSHHFNLFTESKKRDSDF